MHSIVMPSLPAFLTISFCIASPTLCCPFLPLTMLQSPLKQNAASRCRNFGSSVPFGFLQYDDATNLCSTSSQLGVDVPVTVDAVARSCVNTERTERGLLQPRPRPGDLVFFADGLPLRPLPPSLFSSKCPSLFAQFLQMFPTQVRAFLLPTCWVQQSHHASIYSSPTLSLTCVCPPSIPPLLALGPTFSAAVMSQLCYRKHDCRGKRFRFDGVHRRHSTLLAGLYCQHRRVLASINVMKEH